MKDVPKDQLAKALEGAAKECFREFESVAVDNPEGADEAADCVLALDSFDTEAFAACEPSRMGKKREGKKREEKKRVEKKMGHDYEKTESAQAQIDNIANHLEMYLYQHDEYPPSLDILTRKERGRSRAVLKESQLEDPWRKTLIYVRKGDIFTLCSHGPDQRHDTEDDICFEDD